MSETTAEATESVETEAPATGPEEQAKPAELGDAGKKAIDAMKAERDAARREAKANAEAAKRLAELEESQKSEQQKIADRAAAAERERDEARTDGLRYRAAARHKIGEDYFDLLGGGTEDEIETRAQRIGDLLAIQSENEQLRAELEAIKAGRPAPSSSRPAEQLKPGATPTEAAPFDDDTYPAHYLPRRMRERIAGTTTN